MAFVDTKEKTTLAKQQTIMHLWTLWTIAWKKEWKQFDSVFDRVSTRRYYAWRHQYFHCYDDYVDANVDDASLQLTPLSLTPSNIPASWKCCYKRFFPTPFKLTSCCGVFHYNLREDHESLLLAWHSSGLRFLKSQLVCANFKNVFELIFTILYLYTIKLPWVNFWIWKR